VVLSWPNTYQGPDKQPGRALVGDALDRYDFGKDVVGMLSDWETDLRGYDVQARALQKSCPERVKIVCRRQSDRRRDRDAAPWP
jgi:hypothetical protein